jgi:CubicO group peptidase (beta-lactamase class C family)
MILFEEGKIKLDDPSSKYIPEFKEQNVVTDPDSEQVSTVPAEREMTVRDLMRHTSGLTYGVFGNTNVDKLYRKSIKTSAKLSFMGCQVEDWRDDMQQRAKTSVRMDMGTRSGL